MVPPSPEVAGIESWLDAVVLLRQGRATCAGARVAPDRVLTAYHCVASGGHPGIEERDGTRTVGQVSWVDRGADLALVDVPASDAPWLPVATAPPAPGEGVWALGHPGGADLPAGMYAGTLRWSVSWGVVSAVGPVALQTTAAVNPGSSGGPLVDEQGRVVGVVSRRLSGQSLGFAGRADLAQEALAGEERHGLSPIGGTWGGEIFGASQDGLTGGTLALGVRAEVALRDRVVVDGALLLPLAGDLSAARFGDVVSGLGEVRGGLRQRFGRGPWAASLDATGGIAAIQTTSRASIDDPLDLDHTVAWSPIVGGALRLRAIGFELAWLPEQAVLRTSAIFRFPGTIGVF
ncbi:MAG: trypsin-like peptidase domain-containing protein [Alphaproteobacteria bacterium]|nr:trypsin-like peptidase domain-containing protein [Alphaproteobacteria bacterium]